MRFIPTRLASLFFAAIVMLQGIAVAQDLQPVQSPADAQAQHYTDQEVDMFVSSYKAIMEVREKYAAQLQDEQDEEKVREIQDRANEEMTSKVGQFGLGTEKYNEMAQNLQTNPELMERVMKKLQ